jgi:hypothetical protein
MTPSHSDIENAKRALAKLRALGEVEEVLLLPAILGGERNVQNIVYLPPSAAAEKAIIDAEIAEQVRRGEIVDYDATPEYEGITFIPRRLRIRARSRSMNIDQTLSIPVPRSS